MAWLSFEGRLAGFGSLTADSGPVGLGCTQDHKTGHQLRKEPAVTTLVLGSWVHEWPWGGRVSKCSWPARDDAWMGTAQRLEV